MWLTMSNIITGVVAIVLVAIYIALCIIVSFTVGDILSTRFDLYSINEHANLFIALLIILLIPKN